MKPAPASRREWTVRAVLLLFACLPTTVVGAWGLPFLAVMGATALLDGEATGLLGLAWSAGSIFGLSALWRSSLGWRSAPSRQPRWRLAGLAAGLICAAPVALACATDLPDTLIPFALFAVPAASALWLLFRHVRACPSPA